MNDEIIIPEEYKKAYVLHKQIKATVQSVKESYYELGTKLKEMKDCKYYKELGYQNFEEYCETEAGIGQRQAYRMIQISENLPEDFVTSMSKIGSTKLSFLAVLEPEERQEVQQAVDVEAVSVRELKTVIDALKADKKETEQQYKKSEEQCKKLTNENSQLSERVTELEEQIEELENRPIEVAVEDNKDDIRKLNDKHNAELEKIKTEYEQKLSEAEKNISGESVTDTKAIFKAYLSNAVDSVNRLLSFLASNPDEEFFTNKTIEFFNRALDGVGNIKK